MSDSAHSKIDTQAKGIGNICGSLFTILMLIIMFSVAHGRFQELIYISLAFVAVSLLICIVCAFCNTVCKGDPMIDYWTSSDNTVYSTRPHSFRYRHQLHHHHHHHPNAANNNNNNAMNGGNRQHIERRVHVCAPPRMGGARLNIIYTIGEEMNPIALQSLASDSPDFVAINMENERNASLSRVQSLSRSQSPSSRRAPQPIATIMPISTSSYPRIISRSAPTSPRLAVLLPPENIFTYNHDLPPQYDQLVGLRPPSYQEAIEKG